MVKIPTFEQEWISPILEVYKKRKLTDTYTVILGLNPAGQALCKNIYERAFFETVLVFNSPAFSSWNRFPSDLKPPVIPVQGMISNELMLIFGDVIIREYEWITDLLFYLRGNVPTRFIVGLQTHEGATVGQVITRKGERLLKRMGVPMGRSDFYDGLTAPLNSLGNTVDFDSVVIYLEESVDKDIVLQIDEIGICSSEVELAKSLLEKGLDIQLST